MKKVVLLLVLIALAMGAYAQKLTIYCEDDKPFQYMDANKQLAGMVVEMVREIQKRVGNTDPIQMVPWARGYKEIQANPNVVLFSMSRNAERNGMFQWVGPISETAYTFYAKADSKITIPTIEAAKKVGKIGVPRDDIRDQYLTGLGFENLERVPDNITNLKKMMIDRIDLYATSQNNIATDLNLAGLKDSDVKPIFTFLRVQVFIAMSKATSPAIVKQWNEALDAMKKDGTFKTIFKSYYPDRPLPGPAIETFQ
jgi:polar amino acid transport system substrate-binding protein